MRSAFPAHFRPTPEDLSKLWTECIFAIDANVLLNLYRYSVETRRGLETALRSVQAQLFVPHQAAREFLKNRLTVTAAQAAEYQTVIRQIEEVAAKLEDKKKHPSLPEPALTSFSTQLDDVVRLLEAQRTEILDRMTNDEVLEFAGSIAGNRTGPAFSETELDDLAAEGSARYAKKTPPGYKDQGKNDSADPLSGYGDLIVWRQLIAKAKSDNKPLIFITDDKKDDWWLTQSGRTIGPRTELRQEFLEEVSQEFWMYSVERFVEESSKRGQVPVSIGVLEEIRTVREEVHAASVRAYTGDTRRAITTEEMLQHLQASERWASERAEGFVGVHLFVRAHLVEAGYDDIPASYAAIRQLEAEGLVEIYDRQGEGHPRPVRSIRLRRAHDFESTPLGGLAESSAQSRHPRDLPIPASSP